MQSLSIISPYPNSDIIKIITIILVLLITITVINNHSNNTHITLIILYIYIYIIILSSIYALNPHDFAISRNHQSSSSFDFLPIAQQFHGEFKSSPPGCEIFEMGRWKNKLQTDDEEFFYHYILESGLRLWVYFRIFITIF